MQKQRKGKPQSNKATSTQTYIKQAVEPSSFYFLPFFTILGVVQILMSILPWFLLQVTKALLLPLEHFLVSDLFLTFLRGKKNLIVKRLINKLVTQNLELKRVKDLKQQNTKKKSWRSIITSLQKNLSFHSPRSFSNVLWLL